MEVSIFYCLDDAVLDRLELQFDTFIGNAGNTKVVKLDYNDNIFDIKFRTNEDKDVPETPLTLNAINLRVRYHIGDEVEKDCSCDSTYMLSAMNRVGIAMRQKIFLGKHEPSIIFDNGQRWGPWNRRCNYTIHDKHERDLQH